MAYRPCQTRTSPAYATTSGQNTPIKSPITSQSLPSPNFKPPLMAPFSIVRTSTPRLSVFTAHAYTTNPLSRLSKILRSLNNFLTNQSLLSLHSLNSFNDNMAKLIPGQLALDANSHQDTFWPNERKTFAVADPSSLLWTHPSDLCSTSWLA